LTRLPALFGLLALLMPPHLAQATEARPAAPQLTLAQYSPYRAGAEVPTRAYVDQLQASFAFCRAISNRAYLVDCLAERIGAVAAGMPASGEMSAMRAALVAASQDLGAVANRYRSGTTPPVRMQRGGARPMATSRPLRPVAPENLDLALAAATTIVAETETVLLRSAAGSRDRALDFRQVAAVIGSSKALLRSS
jgi:hypothetical protein